MKFYRPLAMESACTTRDNCQARYSAWLFRSGACNNSSSASNTSPNTPVLLSNIPHQLLAPCCSPQHPNFASRSFYDPRHQKRPTPAAGFRASCQSRPLNSVSSVRHPRPSPPTVSPLHSSFPGRYATGRQRICRRAAQKRRKQMLQKWRLRRS